MRVISSALICSIFSVGLFSTAYAASGQQGYQDPNPELKSKEFILMLPSGVDKTVYAGFNGNFDVGGDYAALPALSDQNVVKECVNRSDEVGLFGPVGAAIIGIFAKVFIENAFTATEAKLAKKLEDYESTYQANQSIQPLVTKCVRFVRGTSTTEKFTPNFDIVVKLEPSTQHSMMQMKVLQVKTGKAKALGKVSYAVSAEFEGFYSDQNNIGQSIKYDEQVIHTGKYGTDKLPEACLIEAQGNWDACAPVFAYPGLKSQNGIANLSIKVTEVGTDKRKAKLEQWRELLGQVKGDVSDTLSGAIEELLE